MSNISLAGHGPVRICCGGRHWGAVCNDGLVMCCLCFNRVTKNDLMRDAEDRSKLWDICLSCGFMENLMAIFITMAGGRGSSAIKRRDDAMDASATKFLTSSIPIDTGKLRPSLGRGGEKGTTSE